MCVLADSNASATVCAVDADLCDLLRGRDADVDRLLGLGVLSAQRHLVDLLHSGDARIERPKRRRPLELDRVLGGRFAQRCQLPIDDQFEPASVGKPPDQLPIGLVVLLHELVRLAARIALGLKAGLRQQLGDDVARCLVLEGPYLARPHQHVRVVVCAHRQLHTAGAPPRFERHDLALEHGRGRQLVARAQADLETAADVKRALVDRLALSGLGLGERCGERARVGQAKVVLNADLADASTEILVDLRATHEDRVLRYLPLGSCCAHASNLGIVSSLPRRRRSGLSIPLASAIVRHFVASP